MIRSSSFNWAPRRLVAGVVGVLAGLAGVLAVPAPASANPNPIDWTVVATFLGHFGNDVPLRVGQFDHVDDDGDVEAGFGQRHIVQKHGVVPPAFDIQETIGNAENCQEGGFFDSRIRCFNDDTLLFVVYSPRTDRRSGDGRPFGIITAFYTLPCLAAAGVGIQQCPTDPEPVATSLAYTGPTRLPGGTARLSARLTDELGIPVVNRTVRFTVGAGPGQPACSGTTDEDGTARCTVDVPPASGPVTVHVSFAGDGELRPSSTSSQVVVDLPPVVNAGPDVTGDEAAAVTLRGSATDDGGTPSSTWTYTAGPDVDAGARCDFADASAATTTVSCTDDGTFTVTLTASDGFNPPVSDTAELRLANVPPKVTLAGPKPWQLFRVGESVTLSATFTDAANDTHTCRIAWDDGTAETVAPTAHSCAKTHRFTRAGMFTIDTTVTDDDGGQGTGRVMVVVYDPAAGVPRGNGWLTAPGQEGFDFTASYPSRSATVPDGAVTFSLPPPQNLNLRSHQLLEWLVVTPNGRFAIKGSAERIPGQRVGFVLYGYDGCAPGQTSGCQPGPDRLRVVVWDSTARGPIPDGVPLIYDNRAGLPFDLDEAAPQPIHSGVIHIQHPPMA